MGGWSGIEIRSFLELWERGMLAPQFPLARRGPAEKKAGPYGRRRVSRLTVSCRLLIVWNRFLVSCVVVRSPGGGRCAEFLLRRP